MELIKLIDNGCPDNLIVAFSASAPIGKFQYYKLSSSLESNVLLINCPENQYYHFGMPIIGDFNNTVNYLNDYISSISSESTSITLFGCSMGGYAALLFSGYLNRVKDAFAFSPTCPMYCEREVVKRNQDSHNEAFKSLRKRILTSKVEKTIIYGGIEKSDFFQHMLFLI